MNFSSVKLYKFSPGKDRFYQHHNDNSVREHPGLKSHFHASTGPQPKSARQLSLEPAVTGGSEAAVKCSEVMNTVNC